MHFHNLFQVYCSDTENSRTKILGGLIFSSSEVLFELRVTRGQDFANKEGEEALQSFPVSDIRVQWPLCVT